MTTVRVTENTSATPEQFLAALTDFGPHRSEVWINSQPKFLVVHGQGDTWADVTEGSAVGGGVWERLRYDWSNPLDIVLTTTDSNTWGRKSGHRYTLTSNANGGTTVQTVMVRDGISMKGRALAVVLTVVGRSFLRKGMRGVLRAIEARSGTPRT